MSEQLAREIVVKWRRGETRRSRNRTRLYTDDAGRLKLGGEGGKSGTLPPGRGGTGHDGGAERPLGDPDDDGALLTSTAAGARSWVLPEDLPIPAGTNHAADTLGALLDELFRRVGDLESAQMGYGFQPYGTSAYPSS